MRIACLQFSPQVGDVDNNLNRADAVLSRANPKDLDLLVLPELAFSGYNFRSLQHITPYLEPTSAGITSLWARTTALKYNCVVTAGYPEKVDVAPKWPAGPEHYNSAIIVNSEGETIGNYRKSFLYYTDETWALEGSGFFSGTIGGFGEVAMGICMDLNPYKFEVPWNAWEFANHCIRVEANLVILSMAWLTREGARAYSRAPREPDMETLSYWLARLEPLIRAEAQGEIIVVFANRCGTEDEAVYAGTSAVLGINAGEVKVYGILGRGEKELLVVDTDKRPQAKLVSEKTSLASLVVDNTSQHAETDSQSEMDHSANEEDHFSANDNEDYKDQYDDGYGEESNEAYGFSPVSPTDPRFPQAYFGRKKSSYGGDKPRDSLISSIGQTSSPTFQRPPSPKSRNASRNRQRGASTPEPDRILLPLERNFGPAKADPMDGIMGLVDRQIEPTMASNINSDPRLSHPVPELDAEFTNEDLGPSHKIIDLSLLANMENASVSRLEAGLDDDVSKFSGNALVSTIKLNPALTANIGKEPIFGQFQPHSAPGLDSEESTFTHNELGPRSTHVSARPRSTVW